MDSSLMSTDERWDEAAAGEPRPSLGCEIDRWFLPRKGTMEKI
jgi:hypothetical protein